MPEALRSSVGPYTIEEWLALDPPADGSRVELVFGHLHVTPALSGERQSAAFRLAVVLREGLRAAGRDDLHVVPAVNVEISTAWRTALIPDVVILNRRPVGVSFPPDAVALAVEVWSPANRRAERETKIVGYAAAGVQFLWTVEQGSQFRDLTLTAHRLDGERYTVENVVEIGEPAVVTASPVPVTIDLSDFIP
ncbi:Uma2 family endonuclease [Actinokineospora sp. 24-640]